MFIWIVNPDANTPVDEEQKTLKWKQSKQKRFWKKERRSDSGGAALPFSRIASSLDGRRLGHSIDVIKGNVDGHKVGNSLLGDRSGSCNLYFAAI